MKFLISLLPTRSIQIGKEKESRVLGYVANIVEIDPIGWLYAMRIANQWQQAEMINSQPSSKTLASKCLYSGFDTDKGIKLSTIILTTCDFL